MNTLLLVPDGVGLRNFLLGDFVRRLGEAGATCVLHNVPEDLLPTYNAGFKENVSWEALVPYRESATSYALREYLNFAQMYWGDTKAMRYTRSARLKGGWKRRMARRSARVVGRLAASQKGINLLDQMHCAAVERLPEVVHYRRLFTQLKPSVLFCSHQRPPVILPAVLAARGLGIPTATFIFSWDNLTSKGRIAAPFDYYLVWSEHMKNELLRYYPDVTEDRVHIVGTPQFDSYANEKLLWSREDFYARVGADTARPLISYTGGVRTISPEDPEWISIVLEAIRREEIKGKPQVLLRPAPVDEQHRYDEVRRKYPELLFAEPEWIRTDSSVWRDVLPTANDVQFLANLTHHVDLNINMASTMTLDFAIHDKPVINIAFDVANPPFFKTPLWDFFYQWEHYRPVVEIGAARFARSAQELIEYINAYLENPALDRANRQRLVDMQVGQRVGESSKCMIEALRKIAQPNAVNREVLPARELSVTA